MNKSKRRKLALVLIIAGILLVLSPLVLYWFIHGDSDRYLWIISGPAPFSSFGSGPFQLFMYAGLVVFGLVLATAGIITHFRQRIEHASLS
ncbi:hypothetical protein [Homoserinimonas sp. OAct 916]|uniref:hypothetical protein n=1 Tax=Homoserinimonas sp. OAct 916 TaxID=2211450 RepID=UPI0018E52A6E|nr:hypothetical protein [Homoserinimonas sp. OAct 916]